ncbi:hypothetical protein, partial [Staphylococcus epidermidis]|uniref:hypothetical protein n=1 Tax=Staphylococcus epidermidis TaxID=1282 RepID=UPI001D0D556F
TFLFKSQLTSVIIYTTLLNNKMLFVKLNPHVGIYDVQLYLYDINQKISQRLLCHNHLKG